MPHALCLSPLYSLIFSLPTSIYFIPHILTLKNSYLGRIEQKKKGGEQKLNSESQESRKFHKVEGLSGGDTKKRDLREVMFRKEKGLREVKSRKGNRSERGEVPKRKKSERG